jgi:hypothetical protein
MTQEQMLQICGQVPGWIQTDECVWLFEAAARLARGQSWVNVGPWQGRSFLAAGLGLPKGSSLKCVDSHPGTAENLSPAIRPAEESVRNIDRLRELRPELTIDRAVGAMPDAARTVCDASLSIVFIDGCRNFESVSAQIQAWRSKIAAGGRLVGHGYGLGNGLGVTRAVVQLLPGVASGMGTIWTWTPPAPLQDAATLPRLSVIVATTGRPSLATTLASIKSQRLLGGDEVLLVHDGQAGAAAVAAWDQAELPGQIVVLGTGPHRDWGAAARTAGQSLAKGTHLLWQDDDDLYLPGAFDVIRREIVASPEDILVFRLVYPDGRVLWKEPAIAWKNVSTQMYVIPRTARLGQWGIQYWGDFEFLQSTVNANPGRPVCFVDRPIVMYGR